MKAFHLIAARRLKREMSAARERSRRGWAREVGDEEFVRPEEAGSLTSQRDTERFEDRSVKALAALEVGNNQLQVIDEPPAMKFVRFHRRCLTLIRARGHAFSTRAFGIRRSLHPNHVGRVAGSDELADGSIHRIRVAGIEGDLRIVGGLEPLGIRAHVHVGVFGDEPVE